VVQAAGTSVQLKIGAPTPARTPRAQIAAASFPAPIRLESFHEPVAIVNAGSPPDLEKIKAAMTRHGLVPAPPQK